MGTIEKKYCKMARQRRQEDLEDFAFPKLSKLLHWRSGPLRTPKKMPFINIGGKLGSALKIIAPIAAVAAMAYVVYRRKKYLQQKGKKAKKHRKRRQKFQLVNRLYFGKS